MCKPKISELSKVLIEIEEGRKDLSGKMEERMNEGRKEGRKEGKEGYRKNPTRTLSFSYFFFKENCRGFRFSS